MQVVHWRVALRRQCLRPCPCDRRVTIRPVCTHTWSPVADRSRLSWDSNVTHLMFHVSVQVTVMTSGIQRGSSTPIRLHSRVRQSTVDRSSHHTIICTRTMHHIDSPHPRDGTSGQEEARLGDVDELRVVLPFEMNVVIRKLRKKSSDVVAQQVTSRFGVCGFRTLSSRFISLQDDMGLFIG